MLLLFELPTLLLLSSLFESPLVALAITSLFYYSVVKRNVKIARSWLRGCLPGVVGGSRGSIVSGIILGSGVGDSSSDFDSSDHYYLDKHSSAGGGEGEGGRRYLGPVIRLTELGEEVSRELDRVMCMSMGDGDRGDSDSKDDSSNRNINQTNQTAAAAAATLTRKEARQKKEKKDNEKDDNIHIQIKKMDSTNTNNHSMQPPKLKKQYQTNKDDNGDDAAAAAAADATQKDTTNDNDIQNTNTTNENDAKNNNEETEVDIDMEVDTESMDIDQPTTNNNTSNNNEEEEGEESNAIQTLIQNHIQNYSLDCYPYTFSPLLLFTNSGYFDRGYSNYNAVAAFFAPALKGLGVAAAGENNGVGGGKMNGKTAVRRRSSANGSNSGESKCGGEGGGESKTDDDKMNHDNNNEEEEEEDYGIDMLHNVIYDRKNLTYDELFNHIAKHSSLVTCCIDAHFTAFQMLGPTMLLYYDPLQPAIHVAKGERDVYSAALYLLMKCHYGDNGHVQDNKKHYMGNTSSRLQNAVWGMWKKLNNVKLSTLGIRWHRLPLNLEKDMYLFCNAKGNCGNMSVQLTGNTCYFQTYL